VPLQWEPNQWVACEVDSIQTSLKLLFTLQQSLSFSSGEKLSWARICKPLGSPGIDSASLWSLAGLYDNLICRTGYILTESIPGLLKHLQIRALYRLLLGAETLFIVDCIESELLQLYCRELLFIMRSRIWRFQRSIQYIVRSACKLRARRTVSKSVFFF
jgi:hypothetical protein